MNESQLKRTINTVGKWYFVSFIGDVLVNYSKLQDSLKKEDFISKMRDRVDGGEISYESARTKINAMISMVRERKVMEALQIIVNETNPSKVPEGTINQAKEMLAKIQSGYESLPS